MNRRILNTIVAVVLLVVSQRVHGFFEEIVVYPPEIQLDGNFDSLQVLVSSNEGGRSDKNAIDLTGESEFSIPDESIARVDARGRIFAVANGESKLHIAVRGVTKSVPVRVIHLVPSPTVDFVNDVQPVLYRSGCNAGSCHASQYGKGGFTLSVMGFDPSLDHHAITMQSRGRRLTTASPADSLLLQKGTMTIAHGGGVRFEKGSIEYEILKTWIASGAPRPKQDAPKISKVSVQPAIRVIDLESSQQVRVLAEYTDGRKRDVTGLARFDSMDESVLTVDAHGMVRTVGKGQGVLMVRFAGQAELATFIVPFAPNAELAHWKPLNFIDQHAATKFAELGISPSEVCDDATFLRRAYLDAIGTLPTLEDTKTFLDSKDPDKRQRLVDELLGFSEKNPSKFTDAYAAYWSLKWADLIRNNSTVVGESGMWAFHNWLRESFRTNKKMDDFVRELITAKGSIFSNGPANYYRIANNPQDLAESTAQLFLGTRLQCAKCHHHPYEKYSQSDYYGFAAHFARVGTKGSSEFGIFGRETIVMVKSGGEVNHPKTGAVMKPTPLFSEPMDDPQDRRIPLANWLTSTENELFARNIVNRYIAYLLGRGLVDPIDDLRSTNPPSNMALMDALVEQLRKNDFDVKQLLRTIMSSRLYQLNSQPNAKNAADTKFYSHYKVKRLQAETLLDAIDHATGIPTKHPNLPLGTKAIELPDANTTNPFLVVFGKPKRASVCECERSPDENLAQALHTLNGDILANKLVDEKGRVAQLVASSRPDTEKIEEIYLATVCRRPNPDEMETARSVIASSPSPTEGYQDLLWALINSKQFLFVH